MFQSSADTKLRGKVSLRDSTASPGKIAHPSFLRSQKTRKTTLQDCSRALFPTGIKWKRDSQPEKRDEVSVRSIPSPDRAECAAAGVSLCVDSHGNPGPSTEVFQDSPFLRFPCQGKRLISISLQQELSKRLLGFAKITRGKVQLISGQNYRKREKPEPSIKGRDEQCKSRLSWFYL